ncbi:PREDICTED: putative F-box protein PP2-B6 [Camelina sativa]|uniref:F-box protein PP2-B6 n=1 Tax=Camelina sativa TaxID=90675 RepID=A0ABM0YWJ6_CAMSA|nr:PREDICTED: putative F-box protein PP2-B6 [Camelina sativa]
MGQKHGVDSRGKGGDVPGSSSIGQKHGGGVIVLGSSSLFDVFPEDCISNIISFTSPRDAELAAILVQKSYGSVWQNFLDSVWEKFLPADYESLVPPPSRVFSSKKELYFGLCDHFLIEDGKKSFWLEKASGKKCVMLAARELWITWGKSPEYWQWISIRESRFQEISELLNVCAFEMGGGMNTKILSPGTNYSAYVVYKLRYRRHGLRDLPIQVGVGFKGQEKPKNFICFDESTNIIKEWPRRELMKSERRKDGWMEAEIGDFFNEGGLSGFDEIEVSIVDITSPNWKCGVIIQGIEFRPKNNR